MELCKNGSEERYSQADGRCRKKARNEIYHNLSQTLAVCMVSHMDKSTDAGDPKYAGLYGPYVPKGSFKMGEKVPTAYPDDKFNQEWLDRLNELMDKYEPDIIWFDNKMNIIGEKYRMLFLANFYNNAEKWGKEVVCTYKAKDMAEGSAVLDLERSRMSERNLSAGLLTIRLTGEHGVT